MKTHEFILNGEPLPARISMGALRRFKNETGKDLVKDLKGEPDGVEMAILLWCAIKSGCRAEGREFDMDADTLLDQVTADEVAAWYVGSLTSDAARADADDSKKKN
ncbi:MAG: hypothetical protein NC204_05590 [Candidatus Amulumruptor caecigallinarius]|nr:hypothetical protein [Candidatus Amulumruptor caecigallinarius]